MSQLQIWAPRVQRVEVEWQGCRRPLRTRCDGYHQLEGDRLRHGQDYVLWLDDEGPFPDPRSPWQPQGANGPSRHLDHGLFPWRHREWRQIPWRQAVIYELHVGTFTPAGTFDAAREKLSHLKRLGVTHIELMPVAEFTGRRSWGYDGVNLFSPHHGYGGPDGLKRFVDDCHGRGINVIVDVVYNHLGPVGNHLGRFGPYFSPEHHTPWGDGVNLDGPDSDEVRRFFIDNAFMWLRDYHLDGLRVDAVHSLPDQSALPFVEQLTTEVAALGRELGRKLIVIAESNANNPRLVLPPDQGGQGFDVQWNDDFHHALHALLTGETAGYYEDYGRVEDLARVLAGNYCYDHRYSHFRRRHYGRSAAHLPGSCFVAGLQNHDQIGNRATGERIGHLVTPAEARLGAAVTLLSPFVPMLFQGEEWSASTPFQYFTNFDIAELREQIHQGRQREFAAFGYDPALLPDSEAEQTWRLSQLRWEEAESAAGGDMLDWYQALIALRAEHPDLQAGALEPAGIRFDEQERWLTFRRGRFTICCNFAAHAQTIDPGHDGAVRLRLASSQEVDLRETHVHLPGYGVAVIEEQHA